MSALPAWPAWARIDARVEVEGGAPVVRADIEGPVAQGAVEGPGWYRRTVTAELSAKLAEFRTWAEAHAGAAFTWRDPFDGVTRPVRVEGGAAGIVYRQVRRGPGTPLWTAEMVLEGIARPWPAARSVWSQEIDIGDASHVYLQRTRPATRINTPRDVQFWFIAARLPDAWTVSPPAYLRRCNLGLPGGSRHGEVRVALSSMPSSEGGFSQGPELRDAVERGIAIAVRAGATRIALRIPPSDTEEPYIWRITGDARAALDAVVAAIPDTDTVVEFAICWAGAGSVVDLATYTTTENGSAPDLA